MMQYKCNMWWNVRQQGDIVTSLQTFVRGNYFWSLLEKTQYGANYPYSSLSNFNVFRWGDLQRESICSRKATVCAVYVHLRTSFVTVLQLYVMKILISWYGNTHSLVIPVYAFFPPFDDLLTIYCRPLFKAAKNICRRA